MVSDTSKYFSVKLNEKHTRYDPGIQSSADNYLWLTGQCKYIDDKCSVHDFWLRSPTSTSLPTPDTDSPRLFDCHLPVS